MSTLVLFVRAGPPVCWLVRSKVTRSRSYFVRSLARVHTSFARPCGRAFARLLLVCSSAARLCDCGFACCFACWLVPFVCSFASSCAFKTFIDELNISITIVISVKSVIANFAIENEIPLDRQFKRHEGFKHFHHEGSCLAQREKNFEVYICHTV